MAEENETLSLAIIKLRVLITLFVAGPYLALLPRALRAIVETLESLLVDLAVSGIMRIAAALMLYVNRRAHKMLFLG